MDKNRLHQNNNTPTFDVNQKRNILDKLNQATAFESFYTPNMLDKRFSLEGAESLIPALDALIEKGAELGVEEYNGNGPSRLNVLANIFNTYKDIFSEFEGKI